MQIHQLRYFCAVARTGSFTRAAQQEHLAQPSLSQPVRKLEGELGTRLFDRLGRTVSVTQLGAAFLPRAEAIVRQVADAKLEIQEMAGAERGRLVIGAIPTIAPYFLPSCLASFARMFPRVQISVVEGVTSELLNLLHEGTVDLALPALPVHTTHCLSRELFANGFTWLFPRVIGWVRRPRPSFADRKRSIPLAQGEPLLSRKHSGGLRTRPLATQCGV
jgi:LysR family transcriptional regulator, hydrogen peroxide-inducible genes activator